MRKALLGLVCFLFVFFTTVLFIRHHSMDYNVPSLFLNVHIPIPKISNDIPSFSQMHHVFVIVEENHDWKDIYKNSQAPFINTSLLKQGSYTTEYYNLPKNMHPLHPSEPNYILLISGNIAFPDHTFQTDDDPSTQNSTSSQRNIAYLLEKKKLSWKSYQEDISGTDCPIYTVNKYAPKHNPFVFFQDISGNPPSITNTYCIHHIRPFTELQNDLTANNVPNYSFISPNLLHDMHDGTITQADTWLKSVVPMITSSASFKKDGVLFITWDEGGDNEDENKAIGMIILSGAAKKGYTNNLSYSHASFVKTIQEIFHLSSLLGMAADRSTQDLSDFFNN